MKIIGVFNPCGLNPLNDVVLVPADFNVVYQDDNGKLFIKYLDSGDFSIITLKLEQLKSSAEKIKEIELYLTEGISQIGYPTKYKPIRNEFMIYPFTLDGTTKHAYSSLEEFPTGKIMIDPNIQTSNEAFNQAVIFPNQELYIGQFKYIYEQAKPYLNINGNITKFMGLINWLINNMYLEEAYELIMQMKSSGANLKEFNHPRKLFVLDGSTNFLDYSLNRIADLNLIKENTKSLKLKIFDRK